MPAVLTSWKEIAAHLGKSIRTVQRWERELDLPVRRPDRRRSGIVLADPAELDSWLHRQACLLGATVRTEDTPRGLSREHVARTRQLTQVMQVTIRSLEANCEANQRICRNIQTLRERRMGQAQVARQAS